MAGEHNAVIDERMTTEGMPIGSTLEERMDWLALYAAVLEAFVRVGISGELGIEAAVTHANILWQGRHGTPTCPIPGICDGIGNGPCEVHGG